jgi:hypothetical protein
MSGWIETELKLLLPNEAAWQRIRDALGPGPAVVQENHFLDREDGALAAARIAVRLRAEAGRRILTVKGDELGVPGEALSRRIELEVDLTSAEFEAALAEGLDLVAWLPRLEARAPRASRGATLLRLLDALRTASRGARLVRIDGFSNRRERLRLALVDEKGPFEVGVELDATRFPDQGRTDYELEVELAGGSADEHDAETGDMGGRTGRLDPHRVERALLRWLGGLGVAGVTPAPSKLARLRARDGRST